MNQNNTDNSWKSSPIMAWIRLARPLIVFISVFGALVGLLNVTLAEQMVNQGVNLNYGTLILVILGAASLSAGLMMHNDYTDLESDRVNRPHKPVPSGLISPGVAKWAGLGFMALSVVIAFLTTMPIDGSINWFCGILTVILFINGVLYNYKGKYLGIWGHVMVAFGVGAIPYWGAIAHRPQDWDLMIPLALGLFVMEIGREIMVCAGDIRGDIEAGFKTLPIKVGRQKSMILALIFYLASAPIFPIGTLGLWLVRPIFGKLYLYGVCFFLYVLFLTWVCTFWVVLEKPDDDEKIWNAFERYIRTGTRLAVVIFQVILFLEIFF